MYFSCSLVLKAVQNPQYEHLLGEALAMDDHSYPAARCVSACDFSWLGGVVFWTAKGFCRAEESEDSIARRNIRSKVPAGSVLGLTTQIASVSRPQSNVADILAVNIGADLLKIVPGRVRSLHAGPLRKCTFIAESWFSVTAKAFAKPWTRRCAGFYRV